MTREKVSILGGGIGALTTAYWLSSTPELCAKYDVTVHQMGWRLGGKLASSREGENERNIEHGLHVWFGWYDNAFQMLKSVYEEWDAPERFPWATSLDAFDAQFYTPVGEIIDDEYTFFHWTWPELPGTPGDGTLVSEPVEILGELVGMILRKIEKLIDEFDAHDPPASTPPDGHDGHELHQAGTLTGMLRWAEKVISEALHHDALLRWALTEVHEKLLPHLDDAADSGGVDAHMFRNFVDVGLSVLGGVLNPAYGITDDWNLDRIDHLEFREWLIDNGGRPEIINGWSFLRAIYDAFFQYIEGDKAQPSYAAGTALRAFLRCALTYRHAPLYLVKAGMGDVVIAPMYELLKSRGVNFEFFHKVRELNVSPDGNQISGIGIDVQAKVNVAEYPATKLLSNGLVVWKHEPDWSALEDGDQYKTVDFESKWDQPAPAESLTLTQGVDFDHVVLGISLGAFMPMPGQPGMVAELSAANAQFADMVNNQGLVPSVGIQFWMEPSTVDLGWTTGKPTALAWSYPNDVWADMTQVLEYEMYTTNPPQSLHYLCGVLGTDAYLRPPTDTGVQADAHALARAQTIEQFARYTNTIWPAAIEPGEPTALDYSKMYDPNNGTGVERLDAQWIRANVTPTECCVGSAKGTTNYRLPADGSGFSNLTLCGAWIKTSINSSCVEGAVMSGMLAARAVSGTPQHVIGEHFLTGTGRQRMTLPTYVERLGHNEVSMLPPASINDTTVAMFGVPIDREKAQAYVDFVLTDRGGPRSTRCSVTPHSSASCTHLISRPLCRRSATSATTRSRFGSRLWNSTDRTSTSPSGCRTSGSTATSLWRAGAKAGDSRRRWARTRRQPSTVTRTRCAQRCFRHSPPRRLRLRSN